MGLTHSQTVSAQFSKYGSPFDSYGGYKQYKQYDPYKEYGKPSPSEDRGEMVPFRRGGGPLLAVVALDAQRITVYDNNGRMLQQSPVSTGTTGYETPVGIFSVVQKKADHNSNLYEDGNMPFMQRITWTGIALHAGVLPGRPASHGCVRMPMDFAQRLFDLTDVGMRVIIVRNDIALADFDHPQLFKSSAARNDLPARPSNVSSRPATAGSTDQLRALKLIAASKASDAEAASRKATEVRRVATRKSADAASATKALQAAEASQARADAQLKDAEKALEAINTAAMPSTSEAVKKAETAKEKAAARLAETDTQLRAAKSLAQDQDRCRDCRRGRGQGSRRRQGCRAGRRFRSQAPNPTYFRVRQPQDAALLRSSGLRADIRGADHHPGPRQVDRQLCLHRVRQRRQSRALERRLHVRRWQQQGRRRACRARSSSRKGESRRSIEATPADVAGAKAALDRIAIPHEALAAHLGCRAAGFLPHRLRRGPQHRDRQGH